MPIHQSGEDYLETIYVLSKGNDGVHAVDVAKHLNFSKPSVTRAMKILKQEGFITVDEKNHIILTRSGREKAEAIFERHNVIARFWMLNGVSRDTAYRDACLMEHDISRETLEKIKEFIDKKEEEGKALGQK
ncbi:MAG: metal-dependent transcriptional regulator [Clostridiales bacterium]|jgi:Mn-dependent DtxR family transcriptional regulator|nr:metal-dependent transcriptional regulator [Clostridiales bacterium]